MVAHDDKSIIGMGLDKVISHNSDVIASDVTNANGMGHVPDSYFRQLLKGFRKGLIELLRFGQVAPKGA